VSKLNLPSTDLPQDLKLDTLGMRSGVRSRFNLSSTAGKDVSRVFRDFLSAMSGGGKAGTAARSDQPDSKPQLSKATTDATARTGAAAVRVAVKATGHKADKAGDVDPADGLDEPDKGDGTQATGRQAGAATPNPTTSPCAALSALLDGALPRAASAAGEGGRASGVRSPAAQRPAAPVSAPAGSAAAPGPDKKQPVDPTLSQAFADVFQAADPVGSSRNATAALNNTTPFLAAEPQTQPVKVAVTGQETHFAPVMPIEALQKLATAIQSAMPATSAPMTLQVADAASVAAGPDPAPPVRILTIRLDPPNLGEVSVKMRLRGDNLEISVVAEQHETTQMLQQHREVLTKLIGDTGYVTDVASVQQGQIDGSQTSRGNQPGAQGHGQPGTGLPGHGGSGQLGGGQMAARQSRQDQQQTSQRNHERPAASDSSSTSGGGIYL
jgi:chemotaxis protein MotD